MPHFVNRIQTGKGTLNFYFNRIYTVDGTKYHVSVVNGALSHYFIMQDGGERWDFSDITILPQWLIELRTKLETAINNHLQEHPDPV